MWRNGIKWQGALCLHTLNPTARVSASTSWKARATGCRQALCFRRVSRKKWTRKTCPLTSKLLQRIVQLFNIAQRFTQQTSNTPAYKEWPSWFNAMYLPPPAALRCAAAVRTCLWTRSQSGSWSGTHSGTLISIAADSICLNWSPGSAKGARRRIREFAFRYTFGHSTGRILREASSSTRQICISLHVWALDWPDPARGLLLTCSRLVRPGFKDN